MLVGYFIVWEKLKTCLSSFNLLYIMRELAFPVGSGSVNLIDLQWTGSVTSANFLFMLPLSPLPSPLTLRLTSTIEVLATPFYSCVSVMERYLIKIYITESLCINKIYISSYFLNCWRYVDCRFQKYLRIWGRLNNWPPSWLLDSRIFLEDSRNISESDGG